MKNRLRYKLLAILLTFLFLHPAAAEKKSIRAEKGTIDLSNIEMDNEFLLHLNADWEFYWKQFIISNPSDKSPLPDSYIPVPSRWNQGNDKVYPIEGYASYRLKLLLNETFKGKALSFRINNQANNYRLYINKKLITRCGRPGTTYQKSRPKYEKQVRTITVDSKELDIVFEISNFHDSTAAGLWKPIIIGSEKRIQLEREKGLAFDLFLLGSLIIMSFYHFGLFMLRKEDRSSLAFGIFTLLIAVRILYTGELIGSQLFPDLSWQWHEKIEFLSFYLSVPVFFVFLSSLFQKEFPMKIVYLTFIVSLIFSIDVFLHPLKNYASNLKYFQIYTLIIILYITAMMITAMVRKKEGSVIFSLGLFFFFAAVLFDIYMSQFGTSEFITPLGLFIFIFSQSFILSLLFSRAYQSVQILSNRLQTTNAAFSKFVPQNVLSLLNKEDITAIRLGEQIQIEMPVLFSDIRNFTGLSENMSPEENFNFLNSYLKRIGPIIRKNRGFIDKYLGDGVMALFPGGDQNTLECAIEILEEVKLYNSHRKKMNYQPIEIGIAIHRGDLMLGTIGESERMDATAISDTVNTASRIENLNKVFGTNLIISEDYFHLLKSKENVLYRWLGRTRVKGKKTITEIYEIYSNNEEPIRSKKEKHRKNFHEALEYYFNAEFHNARKLFNEILKDFPEDKTSKYYEERSIFYMEHEDLWLNAEMLYEK